MQGTNARIGHITSVCDVPGSKIFAGHQQERIESPLQADDELYHILFAKAREKENRSYVEKVIPFGD